MANGYSRRHAGQLLAGGGAMLLQNKTALGFQPPVFAGNQAYRDGLARAGLTEAGIDPQSLLDFFADLESKNMSMNSFMLARHGKVVAEAWWWPYRPELVHMMHSFTKSVTVSAIGLALEKGAFKLTDKVVSFYPEYLPSTVSDNLAAMTVEDLLTMRTGHDHMTSGGDWRPIKTSWVAEFYKIPVVYKPGTKWVYTSAATYMLSAIFSRTMGMSVYEYCKPNLFAPLGVSGEDWAPGPEDISPGANGLSLHTADMLKLGLLYQQRGKWNGKQVLPAAWTEAAHAPHVPGKYGYQWWLGPEKAYYADGLFCQYSFVFPDSDAVLTTTASFGDGGKKFEAVVWEHFPKLFQDKPLAKKASAMKAFQSWCATRRALPPFKAAESDVAAQASGRTFVCDPNDDQVTEIRFDFQPDVCLFTLTDHRGEHNVRVGLTDWVESFTTMTGDKLHHEYQPDNMRVVAGGAWKEPGVFEMTWLFSETSFRDTVTCKFDGNGLTLDRSVNVNWQGHTVRPTIRGKHAR